MAFTPIVEIAADSDADKVNAMHHNINSSLGGKMTYSFGANDKWYYAPNLIVTNSSTPLISQASDDNTVLTGGTGDVSSFNESAGSEAHFTAGGDIDADVDDVKFLFIKNTGTSDTSETSTTNSVYITLDSGTASNTGEDSIEISTGEAWMGKVNNIVDDFRIITGQANASGAAATVNESTSVRCTIVAVIADGGHP